MISKGDGVGRTLTSAGKPQSEDDNQGTPKMQVLNSAAKVAEIDKQRHLKRKQFIQDYCDTREWRNPLTRRDFTHIVVIEDHNILYCSTAKVASTTWRKVLGRLEGRTGKGFRPHGKSAFRLLSQYPYHEIKRKLAIYKKFMFVREPFERLLSAYRDKFLSERSFRDKIVKGHPYFARKYGKRIGRVTRALRELASPTSHVHNQDHNVTFSDFIDYILHIGTAGARFNEHWRPYHKICHPCQVQYDIIGHYETLANDAEFVLKETGIENYVTFPKWKPTNTSLLLLQYFKPIALEKIRLLQNLYEDDFEMNRYVFPGPLSKLFQNSSFVQALEV